MPVVIDATQWFPGVEIEGVHLCVRLEVIPADRSYDQTFYVVTIHGQRAYLYPGDWVITQADGEHHYPCKPDIFEQTYEPASPQKGK